MMRISLATLAVGTLLASSACTGSAKGPDGSGESSQKGMTAQPAPESGTSEGDSGAAAPAAPSEDPVAQAVSLPLAGLYGVERLSPRVNGKAVSFTMTGSCVDTLARIQAGQWFVTVLATPDDFAGPVGNLAPWYLVTLSKGQQRAYLRLSEGQYTCDAVVVPATPETVTVDGALTASGRASLQPFQCGPNIFDRESMQFTGFYSVPDERQMLVTLDLTAELGDGEIARDGSDPVVTLLPEGRGGLEAMAEVMSQGLRDGSESEMPGAQEFAMVEDSTGSVTISSLYPLQGEVRLTGLADDSGATLDMTASFYCDTTPLPERADASDDEGGDAEPDGPGSITVDIAGGPLQGTHTAIGDLTCQYGVGTPHAWWLFFGATDENGEEIEEPADTDLMMMMLWSAPPEEVAAGSVMYDEPLILDIGFGLYILDRSLQLHVNGDVGGSGGEVQRDGNVLTFSATTADGIQVDLTAQCPVIDES